MATHNQVRVIGYLLKDPVVLNSSDPDEGTQRILFQLRTSRRKIEGFKDDQFADIVVYYDGDDPLRSKLLGFKQFDIVDIKGVFNILENKKPSTCSYCGAQNIKYNSSSSFVYPISATRYGSYKDYYDEKGESPDTILSKNYKENSNQCLIIGTVVSDPELIKKGNKTCCRYALGVNRKYYIKTQDDKISDYPWVYSYGAQAERDAKYLQKGSLVLVDGFLHNKKLKTHMKCENCNAEYTFPDIGTQFTPYSIEYLNDFKTDEDIEREAENARRRTISE